MSERSSRQLDVPERFAFGRNWSRFVDRHLTESRVAASRDHLLEVLRLPTLDQRSFLDIGCGSGLHSLAALRADAGSVIALDIDAEAVDACLRVRERAAPGDDRWAIMQGSVLDAEAMRGLPAADIVYSWGVLHHTGDLWAALDCALLPMKRDGVLYVALYASEQYVEPPAQYWVEVKRAYNTHGPWRRRASEWNYAARVFLDGLRRGVTPWALVAEYGARGMDFWTDLRDWLGGWPIEFASYREVDAWAHRHGLRIVNSVVGAGCTEYVLARLEHNEQWRTEERRRRDALRSLLPPFAHREGLAWSANVAEPPTSGVGRSEGRLQFMLYDGDRPVGLSNFAPSQVARFGGGRCHRAGDEVLFSTPDGSDPNTEPARWRYCPAY